MISDALARSARIGALFSLASRRVIVSACIATAISASWFRATARQQDNRVAAFSNAVTAIALQRDGKILVGATDNTPEDIQPNACNYLCRLNPDGSIDETFRPMVPGARLVRSDSSTPTNVWRIAAIEVQADQKILVSSSTPDHKARIGLERTGFYSWRLVSRLNADGSDDASFTVSTANDPVHVIRIQPDGKILLGGSFTSLMTPEGPVERRYIARLSPDGSVDSDFSPAPYGAYGQVDALALQPNGKIVVGGLFVDLGGVTRNKLGRLDRDGSIDHRFNPGVSDARGAVALAAAGVTTLAVQGDGKILVGGSFGRLGGETGTSPRNHMGRLNSDGSLDMSFRPEPDQRLHTIALQADGKIIVSGEFSSLGGAPSNPPALLPTNCRGLARLNPNGTVDADFNPGASVSVGPIVIQPDHKILVGLLGGGGSTLNKIGRLNPDGSVDATFQPWRQ